jgi:general secretion pathway protein G
MLNHARSGKTEFTLVDAVTLAVVVAIAGAIGIPLIEKASGRAGHTVVLQNLRTLRSQIELYKAEHGGEPPVLYQNTFLQLIRATNAKGIPGEPGSKYPYGPYLHGGVPVNPVTGRSIVTATDTFPPTAPSGNGGWIYHQKTGRIAIDLEEFLEK